MSEQMIMGIITKALSTALMVAGPILIIALVIGLLVSVFQAATQIQEQTLTFVPKLIAIATILIVGGSWMLNKLVVFTNEIMNSPFIQADIAVHSLSQLIIYALMETLTGLVFGFITNMCFNSLKIAGSLIDQQLGLSMANIYDPNTNTQNTLIETILYWLGVMIFFSIN